MCHQNVFSEYFSFYLLSFFKEILIEITLIVSLRILHFAGNLDYFIEGFIEKNSDKIPKHLSSSLFQSKLSIVQNLFPEGKLIVFKFFKKNYNNQF